MSRRQETLSGNLLLSETFRLMKYVSKVEMNLRDRKMNMNELNTKDRLNTKDKLRMSLKRFTRNELKSLHFTEVYAYVVDKRNFYFIISCLKLFVGLFC